MDLLPPHVCRLSEDRVWTLFFLNFIPTRPQEDLGLSQQEWHFTSIF